MRRLVGVYNNKCLLLIQEIEPGSSVYERIGLGWIKMDNQDYLDDFKNGKLTVSMRQVLHV
jgi:hypothetical protein